MTAGKPGGKRRPKSKPVNTEAFLARIRELEAIRLMEFRLELNALALSDPVYHPIGR